MTDNVLRNYTRRFEFAFYFLHALTVQFEESSNPVLDIQKAHHAFSFFIFDLASWKVLDDTYPFDKECGRYPQLDGAISVAVTFKILKKSPPLQNWLFMVPEARILCEQFISPIQCLSDEQRFRAKQCAEWAAYKYYLDVPLLEAVNATRLL